MAKRVRTSANQETLGRIKCPHCGAGNREASGEKTCWQCGNDLWAPVSRGTYALDKMPVLSSTQFLGDLPMPETAAAIPSWKLIMTGLGALLAILLFFAALFLYLDSRPPSSPAANITSDLR